MVAGALSCVFSLALTSIAGINSPFLLTVQYRQILPILSPLHRSHEKCGLSIPDSEPGAPYADAETFDGCLVAWEDISQLFVPGVGGIEGSCVLKGRFDEMMQRLYWPSRTRGFVDVDGKKLKKRSSQDLAFILNDEEY